MGKKEHKMKTSVKILPLSVENIIFTQLPSSSIGCKINCFNKAMSFQNLDSTGNLIFYPQKVLMGNFQPALKQQVWCNSCLSQAPGCVWLFLNAINGNAKQSYAWHVKRDKSSETSCVNRKGIVSHSPWICPFPRVQKSLTAWWGTIFLAWEKERNGEQKEKEKEKKIPLD